MNIKPGAMLGLLGGGQLGRMFTMAAQRMGYRVTVLDPTKDSPAGTIAESHLCADYLDQQALEKLSSTCIGVTTEFENIPAQALRYLGKYSIVSPDAESVAIAQNRILEKQFLASNGFSVAPFAVIHKQENISTIDLSLFPGILKVSRFGYDGKGQVMVKSADDLPNALTSLKNEPCVLEKSLPLAYEISVIAARGRDDQITFFPVTENRHVNGILDISIVPARIPTETTQYACETARKIAIRLNYIGVLCIEFFVLADGQVLINEIAPRPHNSGHYSLDACITSQFEQQVRVLCGAPQGSTKLTQAAVMTNLLGDLWQSSEPDWCRVLRHPTAKLHLYGKQKAKPGRKMGHFTVLADTAAEALRHAQQIKHELQSPNQT
jgi:5-(carboxyamino)imidazole ribonucleotide synthase